MTRPAPITALLALLVLAATPVASVAARQADGVASGGIGLAREEWEAVHGPGEVGQSSVTYEGIYEVGFRDGVVSFVEFGWDDPGLPFADAEAAVRGFLPADARLRETFTAPATAGGPTGLLLHRYDSPALATLVPEVGAAWTGGVLVVYQETTVPDSMERNIGRVSLAGGEAP